MLVKNVLRAVSAGLALMVGGMMVLGCGDDLDYDGGGDGGNTVTDSRDGKTYRTVTIGTQTWMAENLNYNASGSACYNNISSNCNTYGHLYNWATAMGLSSSCNNATCASQVQSKHRGICPAGWHVPSATEWNTLVNYAGGESTAGSKLKSTSGWSTSGNGTDNYGFSALPGGFGSSSGSFSGIGTTSYWWSATENNAALALSRFMGSSTSVGILNDSKTDLNSVRCLKD